MSLSCLSVQCPMQLPGTHVHVDDVQSEMHPPHEGHKDSSYDQSLQDFSSTFDSLNVSAFDAAIELEDLNRVLDSLKVARLKQWQLHDSKKQSVRDSLANSIATITGIYQRVWTLNGSDINLPSNVCDDCQDLLLSMRRRYPDISRKDLIYYMLTCAPKSISIRKLQEHVGCSMHEARVAVQLRRAQENNAFVVPCWKSTGHPMNVDLKQRIVEFYLDDNNTRPSPNARDARYGVNPLTGIRDLNAKRLIPINSNEFYQLLFCKKNPGMKVHYSTFMKLRPVWCKWPGRYSHHNTCTCIAHENFRSKLQALQFNGPLTEFIHRYMCASPSRDCYFGLCPRCPRLQELCELTIEDETVTFEMWKQENKRMTFVTVTQPTEDLIQEVQEDFIAFTTHHFTTKQQANFIDALNDRALKERAIIIKVDFAENYAFNAQNSPTAFHWNNDQATIHPFCISFPLAEEMQKVSYVVVSNTLEHSALSFHLFRENVIEELKLQPWFSGVRKIYYISDGAGSQYKNRFNFCNIFHHQRDFDLPAEWHFTATAHGKSECDATSGAIKSSAHRAAWAGATLLSAAQLFEYYRDNLTTSKRQFVFVDKEKLEVSRKVMQERFASAETVRGTRWFHSVQVTPTGLSFKVLSLDSEFVHVEMNQNFKAVFDDRFPAGSYVGVKSNDNGGVIGRILT